MFECGVRNVDCGMVLMPGSE